ncbi:hypothetical protein Pmar_PMAR002315 [Perkinsus marinus ATCC 50983]|uniref:Uncharacterized protein n=1 Tax=Perkinsus marinus (strain ATCC 50983 / TXsc) TaxID=423536 RepID=C5KUZ7_PERM5|nr:hypothetical protein Pmar_PMAR002315 [Perkinsus marinus ATCC 50983]EER11712.1 hypothetical protein Pmar_PMAR002315 [Perkinsus marinus ATCC 50983]|eukprot:XP_002779917.1 hypothetical protein Pmar_PMAR002315 [Perkinsus marinus ATCC 50983]
MIYDDGTVIKRVGKKAGWIEDEDGDKLRNMRLVSYVLRWERNEVDFASTIEREYNWKVSEADIMQWLDGWTVREVMSQKRLRWFGHALRQPEGSVQREWVEAEVKESSKWLKMVREDYEDRGGVWRRARSDVENRARWHKFTVIRGAHVP